MLKNRNGGFSIIEILIGLAITGIVGLGTAFLVNGTIQSKNQGDSRATLIEVVAIMKKVTGSKQLSTNPLLCASFLKLKTSGSFVYSPSSNPKIDVELHEPAGRIYSAAAPNNEVEGSGKLKIERLYLTNIEQVAAGPDDTSYLATLFVGSSFNDGLAIMDRPVTTVSLKVNNTSLDIVSCNLGSSITIADVCTSIGGYSWISGVCVQGALRFENGVFSKCPDGTSLRDDDEVCVPSNVRCSGNQISKGYSHSSVSGCTTVNL